MSELETIWRNKADETLLEAGKDLNSFSDEAAAVIVEEHRRRGLPAPESRKEPGIPQTQSATRVVLTGVDMPFSQMAAFIFKWSLAAIPTILFWLILVILLRQIK